MLTMKPRKILYALLTACTTWGTAQITQRTLPAEWNSLIDGGRFMDRFEVMPEGTQSDNVWGCDSVRNRFTDNGIEFSDISVWGGNILKDESGIYHLYACGWPENSPKGHMFWSNSTTFHATSATPWGPYTLQETIGKGHNPEAFRLPDGRVVVYVIDGYYISQTGEGPWFYGKFSFDSRDREIIEGLSNLTFAERQDGSRLMVCRGGGIWISRDGLSPYMQISDSRVYPQVDGRFEDPVVWRDSIQYHLIVNDWLGRVAWYERSKDGLHWIVEPGEAYVPGITRHADGTVEKWFKYERAKVLQDEFGRVQQMNFAVIDTIKWEDLPNDNHSSKNVCVPMNRGMLLSILNKEPITPRTRHIDVLIRREETFNPASDLDISTLRFGSYKLVNFGNGAKAVKSWPHPEGLVVRFNAKQTGIDAEEFAPKIIGRSKAGKMVFGYAKMPGVNYTPALLSARKPTIQADENKLSVIVENFGLSPSAPFTVTVSTNDSEVGTVTAKGLAPYGQTELTIPLPDSFTKGTESTVYKVVIKEEGADEIVHRF